MKSTASHRDAAHLLAEWRLLSRRLAEELGKEVPRIVHEGFENLSFSLSCYEVLQNSFVHLIRNSMDHGLEDHQERLARGKSAAGTIHIQLEWKETFLRIRYSDDGRGLSLAELRRKGLQMKRLEADRNYSSREIARLIFASGLSTAKEASEISGRGVGIEAIQHFLESLGGSLEIDVHDSESPFASFALIMTIPHQHILKASSA